jgi:CheY-like chemotaxis protein
MHNVDILHVEDDPYCVELVQRALRKLAWAPDYLAVRNGEEALAFLANQSRPPRLLLLDLKLPKASGLQVLEALQKNQKGRALPVVVFTSSQEPQDVAQSYQLGANSYIIKPVTYKEFCEAVHHLVSYWITLNHQD